MSAATLLCEELLASAAQPLSAGFDEKLKAYQDALQASNAFHKERYEPAFRELNEARDKWIAACDSIPHHTSSASYESNGGRATRSTNDVAFMALARTFLARPIDNPECMAVCRELVEAADARAAEALRLRNALGLDDAEKRCAELARESDKLGDEAGEALTALEAHPATSLVEVRVKLALMQDSFGDDLTHVAADIDRLLAVEVSA